MHISKVQTNSDLITHLTISALPAVFPLTPHTLPPDYILTHVLPPGLCPPGNISASVSILCAGRYSCRLSCAVCFVVNVHTRKRTYHRANSLYQMGKSINYVKNMRVLLWIYLYLHCKSCKIWVFPQIFIQRKVNIGNLHKLLTPFLCILPCIFACYF